MAIEEIIFEYSTSGAQKAAKEDSRVRDSVKETGKTANQESGRVERWMTRNKAAIQGLAAATVGAMGAILSASPTLRAQLSGVRTAFALFSDTIVRDVVPGSDSMAQTAIELATSFRDLDDGIRTALGGLTIISGVVGVVALALGGIPAAIAGVIIGIGLLLEHFGILSRGLEATIETFRFAHAILTGDFSRAFDIARGAASNFLGFLKSIPGFFIGTWSGTFDRAGSDIRNWGGTIRSVLGNSRDAVFGWLGDVKDGFFELGSWLNGSWIVGLISDARDWAIDVIKAFADRIGLVAWRVGKAFWEVGSIIRDRIETLIDDAKTWGKDIIINFVDGIRSEISRVENAVADVDKAVRDKLSFDITANDKMAQRWGSDFVEEWTDGFESATPQLQASVDSAQGNLTNLSGNGGSNGGGGTVIDLTFERGSIVMQGTGSTTRDAQNFVEETSSEFERKLGGRGL